MSEGSRSSRCFLCSACLLVALFEVSSNCLVTQTVGFLQFFFQPISGQMRFSAKSESMLSSRQLQQPTAGRVAMIGGRKSRFCVVHPFRGECLAVGAGNRVRRVRSSASKPEEIASRWGIRQRGAARFANGQTVSRGDRPPSAAPDSEAAHVLENFMLRFVIRPVAESSPVCLACCAAER